MSKMVGCPSIVYILCILAFVRVATPRGSSIKFLMDQQAKKFLTARLQSVNIIHKMVDTLEYNEQHYKGGDSDRYYGCIEEYIRIAVFLETQPMLEQSLQDEIRNAKVLIGWDASNQKQKDRLNILLEYQRNALGKANEDKETIKRINAKNGHYKLIAPEGRVYQMDLLLARYMASRNMASRNVAQAKAILKMVTLPLAAKQAHFYLDVMQMIGNKGVQLVQQLHDQLEDGDKVLDADMLLDGMGAGTGVGMVGKNKMDDLKHLNQLLSKENILRTFLSVEEWKSFKDPSKFQRSMRKNRWAVPKNYNFLWCVLGVVGFGVVGWACLKWRSKGKRAKGKRWRR
jgi:hypothetical protein